MTEVPQGRNALPLELEVRDPFDFWIARATGAAARLGLTHVPMAEALAVVSNAVGETWLRSVCELASTAETPFKPHPLGDWLTIAGDDAVVEVVELALYLRRLSRVPGLTDGLIVLRENYWTARQQLAYAYRLLQLGAENLQFEPAVGTNRGDLSFHLDGRLFVLESFYPRYGRGTAPSLIRLFKRAGNILDAIGRLTPRTLRITVRVVRAPDHRDAKALERRILQVVREGLAKSQDGDVTGGNLSAAATFSEATSELATITIEDITGVAPDPDFAGGNPMSLEPQTLAVMVARSIPREQAARLRHGPLPESYGKRGTRFRLIDATMSDTPSSSTEIATSLVAKLQRKVSQLGALPEGASRLLLVNVPWLNDPANPESVSHVRTILERIDARIVRGRLRMAGVLAVTRTWTGRRHQYRGVVLEGAEGAGLARRVEEGLNRLEGTGDILATW